MKDARSAAGLAPVGRMVSTLARPVFARYGFAVAAILTEWRAIVGVPMSGGLALWRQSIMASR